MPFAVATVVTNNGKRTFADRMQTTPTRNSMKFLAMGVGATGAARTAAVTDTVLSSEVESRAVGSESNQTTSITGDTYQVIATITASAGRNVDEMGLFDASTVGNMGFSATHTVLPLNSGDSVQYTAKIQVT
jgi:hypothetical protein